MSINLMFKKANDQCKEGLFYDAFVTLRDIWFKYPKNTKLFEEIKRIKSKYSPSLKTSLKSPEIDNYFALHQKGKTSDAIKILHDLYRKDQNDFYVVNLLGTLNGLKGKYPEAIKYQKISLTLNPFDSTNYLNLFISLQKTNEHKLALHILEIGKLIDFNNLKINKLLANQYFKLNKIQSSIRIYEFLIKLDKNDTDIKVDYVTLLINDDKIEKALELLDRFQNDITKKEILYTLKGLAYFKLKNIEKSKKFLNYALTTNPQYSEIYFVYGLIFESLESIEDAKKNYLKSIELNNKNHVVFNNLGACYAFQGQVDLAIENFKKSINLETSYFDAVYRLGQMQIYNFDFKEGWLNFQKRWLSSDYNHKSLKTSKPLMENLNTKDLTVLAWNEQGLGDQIMYGSMFEELSQYVKKLIVRIDKRLINIFRSSHPHITFMNSDDLIDEKIYDKHIPFGHIGSHIRLSKEDFKNSSSPYVRCNLKTKNFILDKYKDKNNLLVGLSWSSSNHLISNNKSLSLEILHPILRIKNIKFLNLEYKNNTKELNSFYDQFGIKIFKEETIDNFYDIEGLSSLIDACDLVISCSNTNAHLSGALSKKTFLLLAKGKGRLWNWNAANGKSIWYPNTKIFEQKTVGDWSDPINEVEKEVLSFIENVE